MANRTDRKTPQKARSLQKIGYIRQMLAELRHLAEAERADMLCYLIEMAYLEAGDLVEKERQQASGGAAR